MSNGWKVGHGIACLCLAVGLTEPVVASSQLEVADWGPSSGFQDHWGNRYRKTRAIVAADFNGDGAVDYFVGNVDGGSYVLLNSGHKPNKPSAFDPMRILPDDVVAFTAGSADYDNDGDLDLYVGCGGLDGSCDDYLLRNDSTRGRIRFSDVSLQAGIRTGPRTTTGAAWGDYDRDGDQDLFVTSVGQYVLWRNEGEGTFSDVTGQVSLVYRPNVMYGGQFIFFRRQFQNSTWVDADNDGDLDLLFNNAAGPNVLFRNLLAETGVARFEDATRAFSLPGQDLRFPLLSFASGIADFNNDGWQDLILFAAGTELSGPYGNGNGLFLNLAGQGFFNASLAAGINMPGGAPERAMGCQLADLNADGIPDLVFGGGGPPRGGSNRLLLSEGLNSGIPFFHDVGSLIDVEPSHGIDPFSAPYPDIPPFPYRTHGMSAADVDGDGSLELAVGNGGTRRWPPIAREPNRLFHFSGPGLGVTFRVSLRGNGVTDSRDAIGARAYVEIPAGPTGEIRRIYRTVSGSSGFSAQNELILTFGLGQDREVSRLAILWPSGCVQILHGSRKAPLTAGSTLTIKQGACDTCADSPGAVAAWLEPDGHGCPAGVSANIEPLERP